jgi:hypothetical protein
VVTCLNCGHTYQGKFCPECGQKSSVKHLTAKVLVEELAHFFTHIEKHFLKTTTGFIFQPGKSSFEFLHGKRKKFQKPISFFFIWTAIYIIPHNYIIRWFNYLPQRVNASAPTLEELSNELLRSHLSFFFLPGIILSAVIIYYILAKPTINFIEVLTISIYGAGCYNAMLFVVDLILGFILRININSMPVFVFQTILAAAYNFWFCYHIFKNISKKWFWPRLFLSAIVIAFAGLGLLLYLPKWWIQLFW